MRAALASKVADERFMAAYVVGERRLRWPNELIPLLDDPHDLIRQAARRSLIILSFLELNPEEATRIAAGGLGRQPTPLAKLNKPVDFGPVPEASKAARKSAMEKWAAWWAERDPKAKPATTSSLRSVAAEADRMAEALVQARADRRAALVAEYRDTKGVKYTEALAAAIPRASAADRTDMRDALAERMRRMTEATLSTYLEDPLPEIRRAAALGLAKKGNTIHVNRLADLLSDPDPLVVQGAHTALCQLSKEDLGPRDGANEEERAEAASQWKRWWQARSGK